VPRNGVTEIDLTCIYLCVLLLHIRSCSENADESMVLDVVCVCVVCVCVVCGVCVCGVCVYVCMKRRWKNN
jgi:hypothetical protein